MNEHDEAQHFNSDVDHMLRASPDIPPDVCNKSARYRSLLDVSRLLAETDFSVESSQRMELRDDLVTVETLPRHRGYVRTFSLRRALVAAVALLVVASIVFTIPSLRSLAQDLWHYFDRSDEDTMTFEEIDFAYEHFTKMAYFLEPAQEETDFDILGLPPQHFRLENVSYAATHREAVMLQYAARYDMTTSQAHYQGIWGISLTEIQIGKEPVELATIDAVGPDAEVEDVQVRGVPGEYVFGQWTTDDPESGTLTWTADYYHQLRWQEDGIFYKMVAATIPDLTPDVSPEQVRDTLITLADSLE